MLPADDELKLRHMLDAAREAQGFLKGRTREDLDADKMLAYALVRCIEVVGEAASGVSAVERAESPDMPWADIVAMRNRLIHGYFDVDLDRVWDTIQDDLPPLIANLEKRLPPPADEEPET